MERATAAQARKALLVSNTFVKAGIRFIPMPVLDDIDEKELIDQVEQRLDKEIESAQ